MNLEAIIFLEAGLILHDRLWNQRSDDIQDTVNVICAQDKIICERKQLGFLADYEFAFVIYKKK